MSHLIHAGVHVVALVAVAVTIGWVLLKSREERPLRIFFIEGLAMFLWGGAVALQLVSPPDVQPALQVTRDLGRVAVIGTWGLFGLYYTRQPPRILRMGWALVGGFLVVSWTIVLTNPLHGLTYTGFVPAGPHGMLRAEYGPLFWTALVLMYLTYGLMSSIVIQRVLRTAYFGLAGGTAIVMILFTPVLYDNLNFILFLPVMGIEYTPLASLLIYVSFAVVMNRYNAFDIDPVGHDEILDSTDDAILVFDSDDRIADHNAAAEPLFTAEDPLGDPADAVLEATLADLLPAPETGRTETEVELVRDGETCYFTASVSPLEWVGSDDGSMLVLSEITTLKEREWELQRENERLDKFTSTVAHDLRNPLAIAQNYLDAMDEMDTEAARAQIDEALERMETMIEELLDLAKQGEEVSEPEPVDLAEASRDAWANVDTDGATLAVDTDRTLDADPDRLANLFENLFRNAVEHGSTSSRPAADDAVEHGGSTVTITVDDHDGGFYVADDGPGIPAEERERVFEHGFTTNDDGTGFGLSIVSEIAAAHGWSVEATESSDGGARFEIET